MSIAAALVAGCLAVLVVLHMTRPRFRRREISAARFFQDLPPPSNRRRRISLNNPLRSPSLYPQVLVVALLLASLLAWRGCDPVADEAIGLWVVIDTSASMTTLQGQQPRLSVATQEARRCLQQAAATAGDLPLCLRLSSFDMELREHLPATTDTDAFRRQLATLAARPLGTDLEELRRSPLLTGRDPDPDRPEACRITHRIVISDLPAPEWLSEHDSSVLWRDIAEPVANIGFSDLAAERDPLTGTVRSLSIAVASYGPPPADAILQIEGPGAPPRGEAIEWHGPVWRTVLPQPAPGSYRLRLAPGGGYAADDETRLEVPVGGSLRVDWRLPDRSMPRRLGWQLDNREPQLTVVPADAVPSDGLGSGPLLVVGEAYSRSIDAAGSETRIARLEEGDPLLEDLNLDVAERLGIGGMPLPAGFSPVLAGDNGVWVARRRQPAGVMLPGLPGGDDEPTRRFSATLFVNALRWLLAHGEPAPLYTLTSPLHPEPDGTRLALHPGEGKTDHVVLSRGEVETIHPVAPGRDRDGPPLWPWLLVLVALALAVEQGLAAAAGERWR